MIRKTYFASLRSACAIADSPIGRKLGEPVTARWVAVLAVIAVGSDLVIMSQGEWSWRWSYNERAIWALLWCGILTGACGERRDTLGLRLTPIQGFRYWMNAALGLTAAVTVLLLVVGNLWVLVAPPPPIVTLNPHRPLWEVIVFRCVDAPVVEEAIYRFIFCVGLVGLLGRWATIVCCGIVFGYLHVLYGNPSPENLVGGAILAWAFFKSGTLVVPVLLHSAGNLLVTACHIASWYYVNT